MSIRARFNRRITQVAVGRHLPHRTVRVRLTLLYGALFLLSGAALMAIAYALLVNAGFVFTLQGDTAPPASPAAAAVGGFPTLGARTHPSAQTIARWRDVAVCMRRHGISQFPDPRSSVPAPAAGIGQISDRDGAIFAIPVTIDMQSAGFTRASSACGFAPNVGELSPADQHRRTAVRQELLIQSGIALAGMSLLSLALGWLMAGRVLQPLEDSYLAQRQFVANASHELRAPLTRQRALIQVALADPLASSHSLRAAHERVLASEQHLEQMIDGLLALTRGQAGLERREHLDLAALTSQALAAHESQLEQLDLRVSASLAPARAAGDPRLLERLIANLIENAIRHNNPAGQVQVTTGTRDRRAFVSIANTGPAIPPEQIQRLFQPFQRLGGVRTHHSGGHGLGLSIVQAIANAHGAELSARPQSQGGLAVEISFPPVTGMTAAAPRNIGGSQGRPDRQSHADRRADVTAAIDVDGAADRLNPVDQSS
jgi:signal transduction histidine kinase